MRKSVEASCDESLCEQPGEVGKILRTAAGNRTLEEDHCAGFPCKPQECCVGTCHSGVCSWNTPPKLPADQPKACKGWDCSLSECCEARCNARFCAHFHTAIKDDVNESTLCAGDPCTPHECCAGECVEAQCPRDFGLVPKKAFPAECQTLNCTTQECCDSICSDSVCPPDRGLALKESRDRPDRCGKATCDRSECCLTVDKAVG